MFYLAKETVDMIKSMTPRFGFFGFSEIVYYDKYSRFLDGQQERWADTVCRTINGIFTVRKTHMQTNRLPWDEQAMQRYAREMAISLFKMEWTPPGRGLWAMGTSLIYERGSMFLQNCAFSVIGRDWIADLEWLMDALMCGCGVGFRADRDDTLDLASVLQGTDVYDVEDSREGWVASVVHLLSCIRDRVPIPIFNYNLIRKKGSPLVTFGGTASGPGPLMELHRRITMLCQLFADGTIDSVQFKTDLANCIGCCVVAGNIRRSAEIALGEMDDPVFSDLKNYEKYPYRASWAWMSNNSVLLRRKSDYDQLGDIAARVTVRGEPGYLNLKNLKYGRIGDKKFIPDNAIGVNPCVIGSSVVLTLNGLRPIDSIGVGERIWSETGWTTVTAFYDQGVKPVYRYRTTAGEIVCTEDHKFICDRFKTPAKDAYGIDVLKGPRDWATDPTDPYYVMLGLLHGDGQYAAPNTFLHIAGKDVDEFLDSEVKDYIGHKRDSDTNRHVYYTTIDYPMSSIKDGRELSYSIRHGDSRVVRSFLRGLYSANGSASKDRVDLTSTDHKLIIEVQKLLSMLGIKAVWKRQEQRQNVFKGETYTLSVKYNLTITSDCWKFKKYIGFLQSYKNVELDLILTDPLKDTRQYRQKMTYDIIDIQHVGEEKVYDITVDNYCHTFWCNGLNISNCGEVPLEDKELCNLAITCPTRCVDLGRWLRACEFATFYASTVALLPTHWTSTNEVIARNRRIGVDILDFATWKQQMGTHWIIAALRKGYDVVCRTNRRLAKEAGVPESIRKTTMKPNGTVSKVIGVPSTHPNARYMLRAIRIAKGGSMEATLMDAGVPHEPCVNQPEFTTIFYYPIYNGEVREISEVSLWEQASNLILLQREWADNSVSNTLYFAEHEHEQIEHVLSSSVPVTKSMSLNAHSRETHPQMPETKITRGEYQARLAEIKEIDWSAYARDGAGERYCDSGSCDI